MPDSTPQSAASSRWKTIPIFISSTFRDMHGERDQLNRVVFPALEERLRDRRCRLEPIDLRVGVDVNDSQSEREREERILKVCLQEIDRSRPFLLVLLGDRYGWVPPEDRVAAAAGEAGFATGVKGRSVTSLEIEYGLLQKDPQQRRRSLIFLRDPLPYDQMGAEAARYSDRHDPNAGAREHADHLSGLKQKLRSDPLLGPHIHRYDLGWDESARRLTGLEAWGRRVEEAIWRELDAETLAFAREPEPTWQEQERFALEEFTERLQRSFVGREVLVEKAVSFALGPGDDETGQSWCFTAESGAGKSAFFSQLYSRLRSRDDLILLAEAGGISSRAGHLYWTLRRWMGELAASTGTALELPEDLRGAELEKGFAELLSYVATEIRVIILVDALNQFERTDRMLSLSWLPDPLPSGVRFLATAIPGPESEKLFRRAGARVEPLPLFTEAEIEAVARQVYGRYRRAAPAEVIARLREKRRADGLPAAGHALWLTLALELLNLLDADDFGEAEAYAAGTPGEKLKSLVLNRCRALPPEMEELYSVFSQQLEKTAGVVEARTWAALIALSRLGWREEDLRQLLTSAASVLFPDLPPVVWDPLRFAAWRRFLRAHLVARGEHRQLDFSHISLRQGVAARLSGEWAAQPDGDPRPALHSTIADYLETMPSDAPIRSAEMMWQVLGAGDISRFAGYYSKVGRASDGPAEFLIEESQRNGHELLDFVLSSTFDSRVPEAEQAEIGEAFIYRLYYSLTYNDGWTLRWPVLEAAQKLFERLYRRYPKLADHAHTFANTYILSGKLCREEGRDDQAYGFYEKALRIAEELHSRDPTTPLRSHLLSNCYQVIGDLHLERGRSEQAKQCYEKLLEISEQLHRRNPDSADGAGNLAVAYEKLGDLHFALGEYDQTVLFCERALEICDDVHRRNESRPDTAEPLLPILDKLGCAHHELGHNEPARACFEQYLNVAEALYRLSPQSPEYTHSLAIAYIRMGLIAEANGSEANAASWGRKAYEQLAELKRRGVMHVTEERYLALIMAKLAQDSKELEDANLWSKRAFEQLSDMQRRGIMSPFDEETLELVQEQLRAGKGGKSVVSEASTKGQNGRIWVESSTPHPTADANRAAELNIQYQVELKRWRSLPWWKRVRAPKPKPPTGI